VDLRGNEVSGSAGDGVIADQGATLTLRRNALVDNGRDGLRTLNGSQATLRENTLAGNEGLAVNNLDPDVTVDAQGNWWGDASGPGGEGPGTGDEVSAGVDYAGWLQGPAGLSATTTPSEAPALPDSQVTAWIGLHTLEALPITVTVTAGDDQGWLPVGYQETVVITQTGGVVLPITVTVPADAAPGAVDVVEVSAEAGAVEARATFTVTVIAPLQSVSITGPTTAFQGETATYTATIAPAEASDISILWSPEPSSGQGATTATMVWNTFGLYPVTVEVEQLGRVVQAEKLVAVWGDNRIYMPIVK
ncbi:MAG: right-handed parallel beta-helix repeat-containing protein, partial [Chloroflexi bacterium]|nr:right-handed parallel beta-helix repeat-containing protein [Chloroflexota bacterium]